MITYKKLWILLKERKIKKGEFTAICGLSSATVAKMVKNERIWTSIIEKICKALKVQPGDIMEYIETEE